MAPAAPSGGSTAGGGGPGPPPPWRCSPAASAHARSGGGPARGYHGNRDRLRHGRGGAGGGEGPAGTEAGRAQPGNALAAPRGGRSPPAFGPHGNKRGRVSNVTETRGKERGERVVPPPGAAPPPPRSVRAAVWLIMSNTSEIHETAFT
ncbi:cuticle collagen 2-like [Chiroxiphia lanceolata]|uniref:cuticle collagen 2-like n=1 Tax=Chiroxiphia lanceolata TaxID=296741 RepID=UPI0013CE50F6|nr:cuticle collagen 2-like [Chiroxiphia lanceolata]